jgi:YD repeat-containing protein
VRGCRYAFPRRCVFSPGYNSCVGTVISPDRGAYSYAGTGYADPDAVTQIANGLSTTSFQYDNDGNVIQKTTDGTTTTYIYDYLNHLTALGSAGATTTYGYDPFGARVLQTGTTTTYTPLGGIQSHRQREPAQSTRRRPRTYSTVTRFWRRWL